jgi:hypothetical protein
MTKTDEHLRRFVILDANKARFKPFLSQSVSVCNTQAEISKVYQAAPDNLTWVACTPRLTDVLLKAVAEKQSMERAFRRPRNECVLTVAAPRLESVPTLHGLFGHIVGANPGYRWLPIPELSEALFDPSLDSSELFIAAAADPVTRTISLIRGDCRTLVVPFSSFELSGDGTKPDFSKVRITDFGRTVALGDYEASTDAILYEMDPDYRKKMRLQRRAHEKSFGASLLRLRKQRKLQRRDFPPISAKTIARLERNEIAKPHGATLEALAARLGVAPEQLGDF